MNSELKVTEYKNIRVLTTQQIAEAYETSADTITRNFNRNKDRYTEGKHYICLNGDDLRDFKANGQIDLSPNIHTLYLWTEKGAFLHAKSLNTGKAWDVYDRLVENYFHDKAKQIDISNLSPELQLMNMLVQSMNRAEIEQQRQAEKITALEDKANKQGKSLENIKDTFTQSTNDEELTRWIQRCINRIAESPNFTYSFGNRYAAAKSESYKRLTDKAHCRLDQKVRNAITRAEERGCTKSQINSINKLSIILADRRLREIYITVIKEMMLAYCVEV